MGENSAQDQYINSVRNFCDSMAAAARDWLKRESANQLIRENLKKMMTYKPFQAPGIYIQPAPEAIY